MRGKKLTEKERLNKRTNQALNSIRKLEKFYEQKVINSACCKYSVLFRNKRILIENLPPYEKAIMIAIMPHSNIPFTRSQLALKSKKSYTSSAYLYAIKKLKQLDLLEEVDGNLYFRG